MKTSAFATVRLATEYFAGNTKALADVRIHHKGGTTKFRNWEGSVICEEDGVIYVPDRWFWSVFRSLAPECLKLQLEQLAVRRFAGRECAAYEANQLSLITMTVIETVKAALNVETWQDAMVDLILFGVIEEELDIDEHKQQRAEQFFSKPRSFRTKMIMEAASPAGYAVRDVDGTSWTFYLTREQIPNEIWSEFDGNQLICFTILPNGEYTDFRLEEPAEVLTYQ